MKAKIATGLNVGRLAKEIKPSLTDEVRQALETWSEWGESTKRGVLTSTQFLAILLWFLNSDEANSEKDEEIINDWHGALLKATTRRARTLTHAAPPRLVTPRSGVSLLEIHQTMSDLNWVLSVDDADSFMQAHQLGWSCTKTLEHWRSVPVDTSDPKPAKKKTIAQIRREDQEKWILEWLLANGYEAKELPDPGTDPKGSLKSNAQSDSDEALDSTGKNLFKKWEFEAAWQRLSGGKVVGKKDGSRHERRISFLSKQEDAASTGVYRNKLV